MPAAHVPSRAWPRGLRRSVRLAASTADIDSLGSEYAAVEKVLGKRIRKRGRGRTTEYLVQFKGYSDKFNVVHVDGSAKPPPRRRGRVGASCCYVTAALGSSWHS